ncbi:hypothetical protein [Paenibacillus sp. H1-7]|uniref:hypothetical protein n=1 Tax=Paenibacillus sp. H1-7 TaxID=2282849 RepID=UPI001EF80FCB|nr:hypothetical protein [Paenibacillus sp. H1-7]
MKVIFLDIDGVLELQSIFEINGVRHVVGMTPLIEGVIRGQEIQSYMDHAKGTELEVRAICYHRR